VTESLDPQVIEHLRGLLHVPQFDDRYVIGPLLGRGGMGAVYRAHDQVLDRDVAIKVTSAALDNRNAERLSRESRILAQLEHPGIVPVHDAGVDASGNPWYAMRLVRGERVDTWANGRSRGERLRVFLQVCDAIGFAHAHDVIHRDIKPGNIMVGAYGEVLVLDWGIARSGLEHRLPAPSSATLELTSVTQDGLIVGTPGYMAPEQEAGDVGAMDVRTDVFGLGALLDVLAREPGTTRLPRALASIIDKARASSPAHRYPTAAALAQDVRHWLDGLSVSSYRERWWERMQRFYMRNQPIVLLFLMYAVVRMIILWWRGV
jgi:eukaryotic-like serine/threonine-protein kinase